MARGVADRQLRCAFHNCRLRGHTTGPEHGGPACGDVYGITEVWRVQVGDAQPSPQQTDTVDLSALTERELDVLGRVAKGETNAEIGAALYLSPATARTYVSRILTKVHARDRTELAILAHRAGMYNPDE